MAKKAKGNRVQVILECTEQKASGVPGMSRYITTKNRKNLYGALGIEEQQAKTLTSITLVFLGILLTAIGVYDKIAKHAGAGTLVPITGFANAVSSPAIEFKSEGYVAGLGAKLFIIAGPVIVYGVSASIIYGAVLWILHMFGITLF